MPAPARLASRGSSRFDDAEAVTVVLVRHGETPMTPLRQYSGSGVPGPGLTTRGRTQAAQAADLLFRVGRGLWPEIARPSRLVSSPMVRTRETARAVSRRLGLAVNVDPRFAECDFGAWEGLTPLEIEASQPGELERWHSDPTLHAPGGESIAEVGDRVTVALEEIVQGGVGRTVVVVTHSVTVRAAVGIALGSPSHAWGRLRVGPGSLSILRFWEDGGSEVVVAGAPSAH